MDAIDMIRRKKNGKEKRPVGIDENNIMDDLKEMLGMREFRELNMGIDRWRKNIEYHLRVEKDKGDIKRAYKQAFWNIWWDGGKSFQEAARKEMRVKAGW